MAHDPFQDEDEFDDFNSNQDPLAENEDEELDLDNLEDEPDVPVDDLEGLQHSPEFWKD